MKLSIKETKEMVCFVISLGNALGLSLEDGKINVKDLNKFIEPLMFAGPAFADAKKIPLELDDMDSEERSELLEYAKSTFSIPEKCVEDVVECAFDTMAQIHILVQKIKECCKPK